MKHETLCGLDIGTTKTCMVVATAGPTGLEIVGVGEAPSLGMRKGVVVDLDETIKSIEAATERAERMAGVHFRHVSSASPASTFAARTTAPSSRSPARIAR